MNKKAAATPAKIIVPKTPAAKAAVTKKVVVPGICDEEVSTNSENNTATYLLFNQLSDSK